MEFETLAIHAGQDPDPVTGSVTVPIYQTSTFQQDGIGRPRGYEYSRTGNPTRAAWETAIAALENGNHGLAFASGVAATAALLSLLRPGDHVVAADDLYGGTYRLFERVYRPLGILFDYVAASDANAFTAALRPETRLVWIETPTNPLLRIVDIRAAAEAAHARGAWLAVDNTFASPFLQRPLELGADIVVHSATKYLGGHSDLIGGAVVVRDAELRRRIAFYQNAAGAVPGPFDCWLVLRGVRTLAVRMREHAANALAVAEFLAGHPRVGRVYYPGLADHPGHAVARRQMAGFGGMVSFTLPGGADAARTVASAVEVFTLAESLGGVESLLDHRASMTHASLAGSPLQVDPGLVRLSVGLEHPQDLIDDLAQALARL